VPPSAPHRTAIPMHSRMALPMKLHSQKKKVVVLEELAGEFGIRTQDAIDRVTKLEEMGRITGVIDDRGKFVFITPDEMKKVCSAQQVLLSRRAAVGDAVSCTCA
jgi:hypothetical protein